MANRNLGIDLLRIVSMTMIVLIHVLSHGGILENSTLFSANYNMAWFLAIAATCAVNCYALISGYVGVDAKFKYSNILYLWLLVMFYSIIIMVGFFIFSPGTIRGKDIFMAMFPVMYRQYWYFSAYFCVFFFIPFLNYLLNTLSLKQLRTLIFTIVILFSIIPTLRQADVFGTSDGYSPLWLALLYLIGGFSKKNQKQQKSNKLKLIKIYLACVLITWGSKLVIEYITMRMMGNTLKKPYLTLYTSPTMLLAAYSLLLLFSGLQFEKHKCLKGCVKFLSPLTFSIYIIHENNFVREYIMTGAFSDYANFSPVILPGIIIGTVLLIYILCSLIDWVRCYLFKVFKIKEFSELLVKCLAEHVLDRVI